MKKEIQLKMPKEVVEKLKKGYSITCHYGDIDIVVLNIDNCFIVNMRSMLETNNEEEVT